ncbi:MAG: 30S ribosomal protein S17 [Pseudomonadota bacterium]|nr:30S ribosomal protein S17 [Gammaproteobacteria bacterium]MBU1559165.1 30S ribosomal protein S17 [Gammaproteobacteria bacterium]MBU1628804.1 30S ribosomal protein S17 [Gammaproteobacteria bacterium]MBU1926705.1 30S ribosomal protein S17 [Gammaproteobacteria bacterium]MBU2545979.1 30S ribosomal protein S17 [Gammaproteobacteria bacterium]
MNEAIGKQQTLIGEVVSNKMDKTIVVAITRRIAHPKYGKLIKRTKKLHAHDQDNQCNLGDVVRVAQSRPLSRTKRWVVVEVISQGNK